MISISKRKDRGGKRISCLMCRKGHTMWENEIVVLQTSLKKRLLSDKKQISFETIASDNGIPAFVKNSFKKELDKYLEKETPLTIRSTPHFHIQDDEIYGIHDRYKNIIMESAVFSRDEVEEILQNSILLRLDYLIKPSDTMRRILFSRKHTIDIASVETLLEPFSEVLPYADQIIQACKKQMKDEIHSDDYGHLATNVFHKVMEKDPVRVVMQDFSVLADFLSETKGEEVNRLDGTMLHEFLVDRNTWGFRRALEVEMKLGKTDFNGEELEMTLNRYLHLRDEFVSVADGGTGKSEQHPKEPLSEPERDEHVHKNVETTVSKEEPVVEIETISGINAEDKTEKLTDDEIWELEAVEESQEKKKETTPEKDDDVLDLESFFEGDLTVENELAAEEQKPEEINEISDRSKPKQMRIIRREQKEKGMEEIGDPGEIISEEKPVTKETKPAPASLGLRDHIDNKTEKVFIKKLFSGDQSAYKRLLDKLEEAESWRVAKILIDNELFKRDVDPFSREAIKLVDLVYTRYYPEEEAGGKK